MAERGLHFAKNLCWFDATCLVDTLTNSDKGQKMTRADAGKLGWVASRQTQEKQHAEFVAKYNEHPRCCLYCHKVLPYEKRYNKFCDQSCAAIYNNSRRSKNNTQDLRTANKTQNIITTPKRYRQPKLCEECGNPLRADQRYTRRFCCYECSKKFAERKATERLLQKFANIEMVGEFPEAFQKEASRPLVRKYLEHKYGHKCSICGITEWMGKPVPIIVDHIDGNALNRKLENFRLVCPNCDAQLPTYKSKNKHGRKWRHKYEQ